MTLPDAVPQRLSDAERDTAVAHLRAHADAGRLTADEFAERSQVAQAARTASEIVPLFDDLPAPHPPYLDAARPLWNTYPGAPGAGGTPGTYGPAVTRTPESGAQPYPYPPGPVYSGTVVVPDQAPLPATQSDRWLGIAQAVIWPVTIMLVLFGNGGVGVIILAVILSSALGGYQSNRRRYRRRQRPPY